MGGAPKESTWEEIYEGLKIKKANMEKDLALISSQIKEAESHLEEKKE